MSTQLRYLAQAPAHAPVRTKYFIVVNELTDNTSTAGSNGLSLSNSATLPAEGIVKLANVGSIFTAVDFPAIAVGTMYRDLGRSVIIVDADGNHLYRYRQVQYVSGHTTEGVGGDGTTTTPNPWRSDIYLLVWSYNGANVNVVRTG